MSCVLLFVPLIITGAVLCNKYYISVADLLNQLDAFLVTEDVQEITLESFGKLEQEIKGLATKVSKHPHPSSPSSSHTDILSSSQHNSIGLGFAL